MDLSTYRLRREILKDAIPRPRPICWKCRQAGYGCFCEDVRPFDPKIRFVILIHPIEVKRRIATGRMAHLCLKNSELIQGEDFSGNRKINALIESVENQCVVLYPGPESMNLSALSDSGREALVEDDKSLVVFVIDGTWATARKMIRSENIRHLPRVCFKPTIPSQFRVRRQPSPDCLSTVEAVHQTMELLGPAKGFDLVHREHDNLLHVFNRLVEFQLRFI